MFIEADGPQDANVALQQQLEKALQEEDAAEVLPLLERMEKLAYEDAIFVPLWAAKFVHVIHPYCKDIILLRGGGPHPKLQYAWLEKK